MERVRKVVKRSPILYSVLNIPSFSLSTEEPYLYILFIFLPLLYYSTISSPDLRILSQLSGVFIAYTKCPSISLKI